MRALHSLTYSHLVQARLDDAQLEQLDRVPQPVVAAATDISAGADLYATYCMVCHGAGAVGGGVIPDLRHSSDAVRDAWEAIVLQGAFSGKGMASFADSLSAEQARQIKLYVMQREYESALPTTQVETE